MNAFSLPSKRGINFAKIRGFKVTDYTTVVRSTDAARAFTLPWGTEGDKVKVTAAQGAAVAGTKPSLC